MEENMYKEIVDKLFEYVPSDYYKVVFYIGYTEGSYTIKYFIQGIDKNFISCFDLYSEKEMKKLFVDLNSIISKYRDKLTIKEKWNVMTLCIDNENNFKVNYDYKNITENIIDYFEEWKKKYIK